ncbi:MAG TPA: hypothetical protein P5319_08630 [Gemmatimonadales bacterium]|nr:hypothetical protein [Gemmatimonadales bacterium]
MIRRALLVWLALCAVAVGNGTIRQFLIVPAIGPYAGHVVSSVTLSLLTLLVAWLSIRWIGPATVQQAWLVGVLWLSATVAFEFLAGHYLFRNPWPKLLADYDVRQGRVWVVVLVTTLLAPRWAAGAREVIHRLT